MRGKKYFLTLAVVYLAYLTHGIQAIVISQNLDNFAAQWGTDSAGVYAAISYTGLAKFLTVWICGEISDKIGRKIMAMIGAIMYVLMFAGLLMTTSFAVACVCAFLGGAATSFFDGSLYAAAQESWIKAPGAAVILIKGFISISGLIYPMIVVALRAQGGNAWRTGVILPIVMSVIVLVIAFIAPYSYDEELKAKKAAGTVEKKEKGALDEDAKIAQERFKVPAPKWLVVPLALMGFINMSTMYSAQQLLTRYGLTYVGMSDSASAALTSLYTGGSLAAVLIWTFAMAGFRWRTLKILIIDLCGSIVFYALAITTHSVTMVQVAAFAIGFFAAGGALQCGVALTNEFHPGPKGRNLGIYYTLMGLSGYVMPVITSQLTTIFGDEGVASRYSLAINLVFAAVGLLFCLYLASQYKKWFGVSWAAAKGKDDIY
ncbi:MAG: MFS transporter [Clostridiales bacterium]|nr:MFS transporter [Clostridiales bacterium]